MELFYRLNTINLLPKKFQNKVMKTDEAAPIFAHNGPDIPAGVPITLTIKEAAPTFIEKPTKFTKKNLINSPIA